MKKLIIMGGLPGSGKSFVRSTMEELKNIAVVDCDEIKKTLSTYDPKNPSATHAISKVLEKQAIYNNFAEGKSFIYDTTATNSDSVIKLTKQAQELGYEVTMVYVKVSLATSLFRNANRERVVPESIVLDKFDKIGPAMEIAKMFVDKFIEVAND